MAAAAAAPRRVTWSALTLDVPVRLEDLVVGALAAECLGVESRPLAGERSRLKIFLRDPRRAAAVSRTLAAVLTRHGFRGRSRPGLARVADARWVERYQASLRPLTIGRRFLVDPTGGGCERAGRTTIALVPGRAFGTGEHPTTRLCVEQLERRVAPGSRWADIGCGTGLLSIVARVCGARRVLALDCDPVAVRVAREVLRCNGLAGAVDVRRGTEADLRGTWDGIVANVGTAWLIQAAGALALRLRPSSWLVASGVLDAEWPQIAPALAKAGLEPVERRKRGPWAVIVARKGVRPRNPRRS